MPTHKSCRKRMHTSKRQNERNRVAKSRMNTAIKRVLDASNKDTALAAFRTACSVIDKTAQAGIIHRNKAANSKARLARVVQKVGA